jgi:hypothetical protein
LDSHDFPKTPLETVAVDGRLAVAGNDDADPRMTKRGNEISDVEKPTPNSLPPSNDGFQVALTRQS